MFIFEKTLIKTEEILYPIMNVGTFELFLSLFLLRAILNFILYVVKFSLCDMDQGFGKPCNKILLQLKNFLDQLLTIGSSLLFFYYSYNSVKRTKNPFNPRVYVGIASLIGTFVFFKTILYLLKFVRNNHSSHETFGVFIQKEISEDLDYFLLESNNYLVFGIFGGFVSGLIS